MAKKPKKDKIDFGRFHAHVQLGGQLKKTHSVLEEEKKLLIKDFKQFKKIEKDVDVEKEAIEHFEKKLRELIKNVVYIEGYIQQIEEGNEMLKVNTSVKELATQLSGNIKEVEELSSSLLKEEESMLSLAKHIKQILNKAKKYQEEIFG